ncbi:MAG: hypothetical protein ACRCY3_08195 [Sphingorhabdus sp.]
MKYTVLICLILASACTEEPTPVEAEKAAQQIVDDDTENAVKTEARNIEEAADAAAKLVEEEAQEEIAEQRGME